MAWSFFFNDTATTEIYTLSLHDALPISDLIVRLGVQHVRPGVVGGDRLVSQTRLHLDPNRVRERERDRAGGAGLDRKSTRLNSSHANISYAVFCLKKKNALHISIEHTGL